MSTSKKEVKLEPQRLELSLNPEDGSLLTAPLSRVLIAATDGLYTDLSNMVNGELQVTTAKPADDDDPEGPPALTLKKEKMSNLSFSQRRHELSWRLARHGKALTHVAALTAALYSTEMAQATIVSTKALKHARTAWVQADEAQDALYFFHAQLFPARQAPHDIYGALDILKEGKWKDLPTDLKLVMDRYESSQEHKWSAHEVKERWHMAVRDKLIRGEVAERKRLGVPTLWKVAINGGIVRLTHGVPKEIGNQTLYPLEAHLTVLSTVVPAQWMLLSVEVRAQAKTGESNHQLDTSNKQRYGLHRLCAKAMAEEEKRGEEEDRLSHPLDCLFQVAHNFSLSWRLEILNAQAQALKRGVWSSKSSLEVTPVKFFTEGDILGVVSVSFWRVDDRYGPPRMNALNHTVGGDLDDETPPTANQLTLSIQAVSNLGIKVFLSGGKTILDRVKYQSHTRTTFENLLDATSNPFALSASNALLAATTLCAEQRCHSMVEALQPLHGERLLPSWMHLTVESGSIAVAASVSYSSSGSKQDLTSVVLFRLACDVRSGSFVGTFCRSAKLLRLMASNEPTASECTALRAVKMSQNRRRADASHSSGRLVRDAFEALTRSMNLLGTRTGVGGTWLDKDDKAALLRERAIHVACKDAKNSLVACCGMAVVYGLCALAIGVATGITAQPDLCGGTIESADGRTLLPVPPIGFVFDQHIAHQQYTTPDGETKEKVLIERETFALSCSVDDDAIMILAFNISLTVESPSSFPTRTKISEAVLECAEDIGFEEGEPTAKRMRTEDNGSVQIPSNSRSIVESIGRFAAVLCQTLHS
ncbi:hypothetical protein MHU86_8560 [Fragilaria crotonensis]|nr:hypothetical protein MHU86_8560 [Fragilaria crotonensis]